MKKQLRKSNLQNKHLDFHKKTMCNGLKSARAQREPKDVQEPAVLSKWVSKTSTSTKNHDIAKTLSNRRKEQNIH